MKHNLAIAYNMQRKRRKMAQGGEVDENSMDQDKAKDFVKGLKGALGHANGGEIKGVHKAHIESSSKEDKHWAGQSEAGHLNSMSDLKKHNLDKAKSEHHKVLGEMTAMKKPKLQGLASGGSVHGEGCMCPNCEGMSKGGQVNHEKMVNDTHRTSKQGDLQRSYNRHKISTGGHGDASETKEHIRGEQFKRRLDTLNNVNPKLEGLYEGGYAGALQEDSKDLNQHRVMDMDSDEDDIVDRIMMKRSKDLSGEARLSEGGKVANQEHGEDDSEMADFSPNEFDDLVLRDDLESDYDGDNAGDHLGNKQEDMDREDIVSRIMSSRRKKDRLPNPR